MFGKVVKSASRTEFVNFFSVRRLLSSVKLLSVVSWRKTLKLLRWLYSSFHMLKAAEARTHIPPQVISSHWAQHPNTAASLKSGEELLLRSGPVRNTQTAGERKWTQQERESLLVSRLSRQKMFKFYFKLCILLPSCHDVAFSVN